MTKTLQVTMAQGILTSPDGLLAGARHAILVRAIFVQTQQVAEREDTVIEEKGKPVDYRHSPRMSRFFFSEE